MVTVAEDDTAESALTVGAAAGSEQLADLIHAGHDPLTLRCVLLSTPYRQQAPLTMERIADAAGLLHRWRQRVADWSTHISVPMPADILEAAYRAFDRNLDVPAVLDLMHHVESDAAIAPGAKFEIFVHLDRVLAFDLPRHLAARTREIHRPSRRAPAGNTVPCPAPRSWHPETGTPACGSGYHRDRLRQRLTPTRPSSVSLSRLIAVLPLCADGTP